jgi:PAS domain S-box-containing protein
MTPFSAGSCLRLLLVEDNPGDADLVGEILEGADPTSFILHRVDCVEQAVALLREEDLPDLVLLDLGLPDAQGLDAFQRVHAAAPLVPVVVISGQNDERVALDAVRVGAQDYLVKGLFEASLLKRVIRHAIERQRTQQVLASSEARLRALMDFANDGISVISTDGVVIEANHRLTELLGRPKDEIIGHRISEFPEPAETYDPLEDFQRAVEAGRADVRHIPIRRPDASTVILDFSLSTIELDRDRVVLSIAHDVTQQLRMEQQLRQAQKMEALGRLAGGVAHDFNNLLTAIGGHTELVRETLDPEDPRREDLTEILNASDRASALTRQLLAFSRRQVLRPRVISVNETIAGTERLLRRLIGEDIDMVVLAEASAGNVKVDPGQLEQVIINLAVNARDAMPEGGKLTIETRPVRLDDPRPEIDGTLPPGEYVQIAVTDTGCGMDSETQARIFEPFFTTKGVNKGTGLGLATVHGIVRQSGGHIWLYSEPGQGSCFKIYLPAVGESVERRGGESRSPVAGQGTETLLLVEDNDGVRNLASRVLRRRGYTLLEASDPDVAIALVAKHASSIDLLVSDVVMPGMSGPVLAAHLESVQPRMKVLYTSGYTDEAIVRHGVIESTVAFLQKPYGPEDLARKVREILDQPVEA